MGGVIHNAIILHRHVDAGLLMNIDSFIYDVVKWDWSIILEEKQLHNNHACSRLLYIAFDI